MGNDSLQSHQGNSGSKAKVGFFRLSTEHYNGLTLIMAFMALIISAIVAFSNGLPNVFKPQAATVYMENKLALSQVFGRFSTLMSVTVINDGGADINLRDADLLITLEDERKLSLHGDSWRYPGWAMYAAGAIDLNLRDVLIKPGMSWTGIVSFEEILTRDQLEKIADLQDSLTLELFGKSRSAQQQYAKDLANSIGAFMTDRRKLTEETKAVATEILGRVLQGAPCYFVSPILQKKYSDISIAGASKFIKGRHKLHFLLHGSSGTIYSSKHTFIAFERNVRAIENVENLGLTYCGTGSAFQFKPGTTSMQLETPSS